jgi:hypothetical protein
LAVRGEPDRDVSSNDPIPQEVHRFLDRHISSVDQLEILLFLREQRARPWSPLEVSIELRYNEAAAAERMKSMNALGLLERDGDSSFRFAPSDSETDRVVSLLATMYRDYRLRVIERIFAKPDGLTAFAEAFRLRGEKS